MSRNYYATRYYAYQGRVHQNLIEAPVVEEDPVDVVIAELKREEERAAWEAQYEDAAAAIA